MWNISNLKLLVILLIISHCTFQVTPASFSLNRKHFTTKEREEDGAYIPRDQNHINGDGQHDQEFDHEAILGSAKEAEEFDSLPPEEAKRRLKILLTKMDLNKDNQIDRNELRAWILRSFRMLSEEDALEEFEDLDDDEDGRITWKEFVDNVYNDFDQLNPHEHDAMSLKHDKVIFNAADSNKDGVLNKTEIVMFIHPEEHPNMLPHILANTLDEKDMNNNGVIDFQEYLGDRAKNHDKDWLISEKEKFDSEYDKNGDGVLSSNEILSWVVPSNDEIALEEVEHLFSSTDDDHDNILSFEEILGNHEIFVGSEATDYGEHLENIHRFEDEL